MKLTATTARPLQAVMQAELRDIERAVASGTREAAQGLKTVRRGGRSSTISVPGAPEIKAATLTVTVDYEAATPRLVRAPVPLLS